MDKQLVIGFESIRKMTDALRTGTNWYELKPPACWMLSAPFIFAVVIGSFLAGAVGCF